MDDWGLGVRDTSVDDRISEELKNEKGSKSNDKNPFNIISSAVDKKFIPAEEDYDKISPYLFLRYFANDPAGLMIVSELNVRRNIPKKWEYWFMRLMMPLSTRFIRFNKKEIFEDTEMLKNLTTYYKCNDRQAIAYYNLLPEEELEKIRFMYKHGRM